MASGFGRDPLIVEAHGAIERIAAGATGQSVETITLDCKEEAGRRANDGTYGPGRPQSEAAATAFAEAAACLANSEGGVLVVGIGDKGAGSAAIIGAALNAEWLRQRIWALTQPSLGVDVLETDHDGTRLLLILVRRSYRLHRCGRRYKHRLGAHCVEMSPEDQRRVEEDRFGYDWSAETSSAPLAQVSAAAVDLSRRFLRETTEPSRVELANRETPDLLRALGVLDARDRLTNAGALLFVDGTRTVVDYKRRKVPGGSSTDRLELPTPLLSAYAQVKDRVDAVNEERELQLRSGARPRIRLIPDRAVREALVNALIHRDYRSADPIDIELVGASLVVASPGGFPAGINAENIISERSHPRNATLTAVFRSLRLAEQEGVGVDRMYRDMVSAGHAMPTFADRGGRVRCVLTGGEPSGPIVALISSLPAEAQDDVDLALILHALMQRADVSADELVMLLQKLEPEALSALHRGEQVGVLARSSTSSRARPRYRLSDAAREQLRLVLPYLTTSASEAEEFVVRHVLLHERIKPKDVADMLSVTEVQGSRILRDLRESRILEIGSRHSVGRGVFHVAGPSFADARRRHGLD